MKPTICILLSFLVLGFMMTAPVYAGENTFTENVSTDWHEPANWTGDVPTDEDDVIIPNLLECIISNDDAEARTVSVTGLPGREERLHALDPHAQCERDAFAHHKRRRVR